MWNGCSRSVFVYTLSDPAVEGVRYVGITVNPVARLIRHRNDKAISHKMRWLTALSRKGVSPLMTVLRECASWAEACAWEKEYILRFRFAGHPLTNATDGGDGALGYKHTVASLNKIRQANLGHPVSLESRAKMSRAQLRRPPASAALCEKRRQNRLGKRASAAVREKMRLGCLKRPPQSAETVEKIRQTKLAQGLLRRMSAAGRNTGGSG